MPVISNERYVQIWNTQADKLFYLCETDFSCSRLEIPLKQQLQVLQSWSFFSSCQFTSLFESVSQLDNGCFQMFKDPISFYKIMKRFQISCENTFLVHMFTDRPNNIPKYTLNYLKICFNVIMPPLIVLSQILFKLQRRTLAVIVLSFS